MRVVTAEMMREIDRKTIEEKGIPGMTLMERAGMCIAQGLMAYLNEDSSVGRIAILVGPGNNGGDGWVCAKYLHAEGLDVEVFSAIDPNELNGDAKSAFETARDAGVKFSLCIDGEIDLDDFEIAIDALLGTGAKGEPRGAIGRMVEILSQSPGIEVFAVDNPTGVDSDTGMASDNVVVATETFSLGLPKLGQLRYPGSLFVGGLNVVDIGIPEDVYEGMTPNWRVDSTEELMALLPFRSANGHKGTFGKSAIIGGSAGMSGAVVMAAESCLRSGTGLVEMVIPEGILNVVETLFREAVSQPVQEVKSRKCLSVRALGDIIRLAGDCDSVAIGPGIGTHRETIDLIGRLLPKITVPVVLDADGLNCLAKLRNRDIQVKFGAPVVMTPHPGELSRLLDIPVDEILEQRYENMNEWAKILGADILVLKGAPTTIAGPETPIYINRTGNHGMATGGSGDVLTGIIAGFLAQGLSPMDSARLGVYIHGLAGDLASAELGHRGMIAGDIIDCVPEAILDLELFSELT